MNRKTNENTQASRPPVIQSRSPQMSGVAACILQFAIPMLLAAPTVNMRPRWGMLLTGAAWFVFGFAANNCLAKPEWAKASRTHRL